MLWNEKKWFESEEILNSWNFFEFIRLLQDVEIIVGRLFFGENFLMKLLSPVTLEDDFSYDLTINNISGSKCVRNWLENRQVAMNKKSDLFNKINLKSILL